MFKNLAHLEHPLVSFLTLEFWSKYLPSFLTENDLGGLKLAQWIGLLVAIPLAIGIGWLISRIARWLFVRIASFTRWEWDSLLANHTAGPLNLFFSAFVFVALMLPLGLDADARHIAFRAAKLAVFAAIAWFLGRVVDVFSDTASRRFKGRNDDFAMVIVPVFGKILKPVAWLFVVLLALENIGINVQGILAGLGIGGIAVALAGKSTLENMFGSITIAFDRPFRIGDTVKIGDVTGAVEDIGLRSTRVRTPDRTLVTIPNSKLSVSMIENFTARDRIRFATVIEFMAETPRERLEPAIEGMRRTLIGNERIFQDVIVLRLLGYNAGAPQVEVICGFLTTDSLVFAAWREELLFGFQTVFAETGVAVAVPSRRMEILPGGEAGGVLSKRSA